MIIHLMLLYYFCLLIYSYMSIRNILTTLGTLVVAILAYNLYRAQYMSFAPELAKDKLPTIIASGVCINDADC